VIINANSGGPGALCLPYMHIMLVKTLYC